MTNPLVKTSLITDDDGEMWRAEHLPGLGFEGMGQSLSSTVRFTHVETGLDLTGSVPGMSPVPAMELRDSLREAVRQARLRRHLGF